MIKLVISSLFSSLFIANFALARTLSGRSNSSLDSYVPHHPRVDNSTFGNIDEIHTTHYFVDWTVGWDNRTLSGFIVHDMMVVKPTKYIQLDAWALNITDVQQAQAGAAMDATLMAGMIPEHPEAELEYTIKSPTPISGSVLIIELPRRYSVGEQVSVQIWYETSATGNAFSWLNASQTAGGKLPYLFT
jgi:leukotriene-A4 hydrolase